MMFALNFMAVRLSQKFSLSNFLIYNKATGGEERGGRNRVALERGSFSRL